MNNDTKMFECKECPYKTKRKRDLDKHYTKHTGEKAYNCKICDKAFSTKTNCNRHQLTHSTERKQHLCDVCNAKFTEKGSLATHMRLHTGENLLVCSICDTKWTSKLKYDNHLRIHTGEKPFECPVCDKAFSRKNSLRIHLKCHERWSCSICSVSFTSYPDFDRHRRAHTAESLKFECSVCGQKLLTQSNLTAHEQTHMIEKTHQCMYCDRKYKSSYELRKHLPVHQEVRDRVEQNEMPENHCNCDRCVELLENHKESLDNLINSESVTVRKCKLCGRIFFTKKCYTNHRETHRRKLYAFDCPICGTRRNTRSGILKHVNKCHPLDVIEDSPSLGESIINCSFCEKTYLSSKSLAAHEIIVHRYVKRINVTGDMKSDGEKDHFAGSEYEILMNVESIVCDSDGENISSEESESSNPGIVGKSSDNSYDENDKSNLDVLENASTDINPDEMEIGQ